MKLVAEFKKFLDEKNSWMKKSIAACYGGAKKLAAGSKMLWPNCRANTLSAAMSTPEGDLTTFKPLSLECSRRLSPDGYAPSAESSVDGTVDLDYAPSGVTWRSTCQQRTHWSPGNVSQISGEGENRTDGATRADSVLMESHRRVIARESGRSSNPGDAAEYWIPAFAGMTPQSW